RSGVRRMIVVDYGMATVWVRKEASGGQSERALTRDQLGKLLHHFREDGFDESRPRVAVLRHLPERTGPGRPNPARLDGLLDRVGGIGAELRQVAEDLAVIETADR